ncbi:FtsX-like permease family protein [Alkaliphilus serpentinus]|uniref:FtsX-like permease family protein n=1 Tax=Alkaliphilus serpentinus TaxID=1482731 RepID=A0A833HLJ4_9FIRM|nr:FtsX-like permease family protein [Alkaliphilus serpentinus]
MSTSLFERKYEIGLYRSIGYNKSNITKILGLEMFFISFIVYTVNRTILKNSILSNVNDL